MFFLVSHFFAAPCCFWNKTISVHFWNQTSFQEWNTLSTFYDWLMKVVFHANVSLSGSTVQHIKVFVSCNKNVSCNMKKNSFYFYRCCMQHFSNRFCCIAHKKTYCSTVKFSKDIHSSNGVLHGHENVAPWPQDLFLMRSWATSGNEVIFWFFFYHCRNYLLHFRHCLYERSFHALVEFFTWSTQ